MERCSLWRIVVDAPLVVTGVAAILAAIQVRSTSKPPHRRCSGLRGFSDLVTRTEIPDVAVCSLVDVY